MVSVKSRPDLASQTDLKLAYTHRVCHTLIHHGYLPVCIRFYSRKFKLLDLFQKVKIFPLIFALFSCSNKTFNKGAIKTFSAILGSTCVQIQFGPGFENITPIANHARVTLTQILTKILKLENTLFLRSLWLFR